MTFLSIDGLHLHQTMRPIVRVVTAVIRTVIMFASVE